MEVEREETYLSLGYFSDLRVRFQAKYGWILTWLAQRRSCWLNFPILLRTDSLDKPQPIVTQFPIVRFAGRDDENLVHTALPVLSDSGFS